MLDMNIDDVRTFVAVIDSGAISRAARDLHLTQPAVTRRVQRLEHAVGAPLIDRTRRPFALTEVGRAAVEQCRRLLSTTDALKALAQADVVPSRELRVGVAHALTELTLVEPLDDTRRAFPAVAWRLYTGWSRDLLARVQSGALDAAVVLLPDGQRVPSGLEARALAAERLAIIAARSLRPRIHSVRDLAEAQWILNPEGCAARLELQRVLARARVPLRVGIETYDYQLQLSLVARGRGLGLVPSRLMAASPLRSSLAALRLPELELPFTIWIATGALAAGLTSPVDALGHALAVSLARRGRR